MSGGEKSTPPAGFSGPVRLGTGKRRRFWGRRKAAEEANVVGNMPNDKNQYSQY